MSSNAKSQDETKAFKEENKFTIMNMATMYCSTFAQGFSKGVRQAAIRTVLKHGIHGDGMHFNTKTQGGLHPSTISFNHGNKSLKYKAFSCMDMVEASLADIFDAVRSRLLHSNVTS
jgi:hypothetical protein